MAPNPDGVVGAAGCAGAGASEGVLALLRASLQPGDGGHGPDGEPPFGAAKRSLGPSEEGRGAPRRWRHGTP
eukprot:10110609-Alexandrium_andersonii.AAC.1